MIKKSHKRLYLAVSSVGAVLLLSPVASNAGTLAAPAGSPVTTAASQAYSKSKMPVDISAQVRRVRPGVRPPIARRPVARRGVVVRRPVIVTRPIGWRGARWGAVVAGVTLGTMVVVAANGAPVAPSPSLCWTWANAARTQGYWYYCSGP
jgi:hypothetical protein